MSTKSSKKRILKIWDDPNTFDRYTIIIDKYIYASSHNPTHPQGFWQYVGDTSNSAMKPGKHWGKRIEYSDLPSDVQNCINTYYKLLYSDIAVETDLKNN